MKKAGILLTAAIMIIAATCVGCKNDSEQKFAELQKQNMELQKKLNALQAPNPTHTTAKELTPSQVDQNMEEENQTKFEQNQAKLKEDFIQEVNLFQAKYIPQKPYMGITTAQIRNIILDDLKEYQPRKKELNFWKKSEEKYADLYDIEKCIKILKNPENVSDNELTARSEILWVLENIIQKEQGEHALLQHRMKYFPHLIGSCSDWFYVVVNDVSISGELTPKEKDKFFAQAKKNIAPETNWCEEDIEKTFNWRGEGEE